MPNLSQLKRQRMLAFLDKIKEELNAEKKARQSKDEKIAQYELYNWKRPRYWICSILLLLCVVCLVLYFVAQNQPYNYPARLLNWIDNLSGIRNGLAMGLLFFIHVALALLSINGIIRLSKMTSSDDRNRWFIKLIDKHINK